MDRDSTERHETRRMLLWFKEQLPPHELGEWYITAMPYPPPVVVEDSDTSCMHGQLGLRSATARRVEGYGRCTRCGRRFELDGMGDAIALNDEWVKRTAEKLKERARNAAGRSGPCWGDVPTVPRNDYAAVLDVSDGR